MPPALRRAAPAERRRPRAAALQRRRRPRARPASFPAREVVSIRNRSSSMASTWGSTSAQAANTVAVKPSIVRRASPIRIHVVACVPKGTFATIGEKSLAPAFFPACKMPIVPPTNCAFAVPRVEGVFRRNAIPARIVPPDKNARAGIRPWAACTMNSPARRRKIRVAATRIA